MFHGLSTNHFLFNDGGIYMQDFTAILLSDTKIASIVYLKPCTNRELRISDKREVIISLHDCLFIRVTSIFKYMFYKFFSVIIKGDIFFRQ